MPPRSEEQKTVVRNSALQAFRLGRLVINGRFLCFPGGGVKRYALELSEALTQCHPDTIVAAPPGTPPHARLNIRCVGSLRGHAWEQTVLPLFLKKLGRPLLINPANTGPLSYAKNVLVLHDMAWAKREHSFSPALYGGYHILMPLLLRHCKALATVSAFSAQEIEAFFPFLSGKIFVVPPSLEYLHGWLPTPAAGVEISGEYFLSVGLTARRKEASTIFRAFSAKPHLRLVVAGYKDEALPTGNSAVPKNVILKRNLDDAELAWLYAQCRALISATRYEGFDLPPLEAAFFGRPSLLSDIPVHREIWNNTQTYFRTGDAESLAKTLSEVMPVSETLKEAPRSFNRQKMLEALRAGLNAAGIMI